MPSRLAGVNVAQVRIARPTHQLEFTQHAGGSPCPAPREHHLCGSGWLARRAVPRQRYLNDLKQVRNSP